MSARQFSIFRFCFGIFLTVHFSMLLPWAAELFSAQGLIPQSSLNPTHGLFPSPLDLPLPSWWVVAFVGALTILSIAFTFGVLRPAVAGLLWFGWTALFHRNNLIANPSLAYVGLLLALCVIVPSGEPWGLAKRSSTWEMPVWVIRCAWILLAAGYTFSGLTKLGSPSWMDGSAMHHLLQNPLARPGWVRDFMLWLPDGYLRALTWSTVAIEILFAPLALWSRSRGWVWLSMVMLHLGIIAVVDFADLSMGMLMIHIFTFDTRWWRR